MTKTTTKATKSTRTGRKYSKLIAFLTARMDSPVESIRREAASSLQDLLLHIDNVEDRKAARAARDREAASPVSKPDLSATILSLQAELSQKGQA
jgi:hypothetical protein